MARLTLRPRGQSAANGAPRNGGEKDTLRWCREVAAQVGAREEQMQGMSDAEFPDLTRSLRARLADGAELDSLLPEAFAAVREAAKRTLGQRHYDVQVIGGAAVHNGLPAIKARSRDGRASLVDYRREAGLLLDSMRDQVRRDLVKAVLSLREHRPDGET